MNHQDIAFAALRILAAHEMLFHRGGNVGRPEMLIHDLFDRTEQCLSRQQKSRVVISPENFADALRMMRREYLAQRVPVFYRRTLLSAANPESYEAQEDYYLIRPEGLKVLGAPGNAQAARIENYIEAIKPRIHPAYIMQGLRLKRPFLVS